MPNLEAALVSNAACHLLFRNNALDLSAFEVGDLHVANVGPPYVPRVSYIAQVQSDSFPVHWNGDGRALDLATTPGRIGLQLKINSKNSLIHFQELRAEG